MSKSIAVPLIAPPPLRPQLCQRSLAIMAGLVLASPLAHAADVAFSSAPPLLQAMCYECHGEGATKGSFALDTLISGGKSGAEAHRGQWLKVWNNVRHEFMPPAEANAMTEAERREVARWIEREVFAVDHARIDPGVVTIRRLNREEYNNTIEDLFGAGLDLRDQMLPDDTAFGFDNIGDAQTLSPALFNRYLDLADTVVNAVVLDAGPPLPRFAYNALGPKNQTLKAAGGTEQKFDVEFSHDGRFKAELGFEIGGWHDFGGDIRVTLHVGEQLVTEEILPLGGDKNYDFVREFTSPKGRHAVVFRAEPVRKPATETPPPAAVAAPNDTTTVTAQLASVAVVDPAAPPAAAPPRPRRAPRPAELTFRRLEFAVTGPVDAGVFAEYPAPHRKVFFRGAAPSDAAGRRAYAEEILRRVADKAFHRPVDAPTLARLVNLATADANFERGVGTALSAILSSPRFLFREEAQPEPDNPRASHPVNEYALASRLSYLLWLSVPDDELYALAAAGTLRANLPAQMRRMLADPKSQRFFRDFTGQWLRTRNILTASITPDSDNNKVNPVREAMKQETDLLFEHIARSDRDLLELITADYTFLNAELATYYGVPEVTGDEMRQVALPPETQRGGLLTHGSFLVATSNPNRTSPVKRGVFVLENLFGTPPPPPPPAIPSLEEAKKDGVTPKSLRAQLAAHREDKSCAACHAHFDPIGLALENFSNIGLWRDKDGEEAVDPSGEMVTGEKFADFSGLRGIIATRKDKFYRCVVEKLMTYALGRGLEPYDAATIDAITDRLVRDGGKFSTLLAQVVESPAFQARRGDGELAAALVSSAP